MLSSTISSSVLLAVNALRQGTFGGHVTLPPGCTIPPDPACAILFERATLIAEANATNIVSAVWRSSSPEGS